MQQADQFASLEAALANGFRLVGSEPEAAVEQAREILSKDEKNREALRLLGYALRRLGRNAEAEQAELDRIKAASNEPALVQTAQAIIAGDLKRAEHLVRPYLDRHADDPAGLRLLAEIAVRAGYPDEATKYLRQAIELAPAYVSARVKLAHVLFGQSDFRGALEQLDHLVELEPEEGNARTSKATTLVMAGEFREAAQLYEQLTEKLPDRPELWTSYAHVLATIGRFDEAVAAYRRTIQLRPVHGEGWWCLANLKLARFSDEDIAAMLATLEKPGLDEDSRLKLHFALGKAFEDAGSYARGFEHYAAGNRLRGRPLNYDPEETHQFVIRSEKVFTEEFFRDREGSGCESSDPIFVIGLPRAGSTLVEQILASHSMIEGTAELRYMPAIRERLTVEANEPFPELMANVRHSELRALGARYLSCAKVNRKTDRPFFVDKLPNNWASLGLILAILPNARIIDARRHPMACCFSNFKQYFARGQEFSYSLNSVGRYYRDYVRLMHHFNTLFPGRIHRVVHERLLDHPEAEIRKLLDYIGVPFEEACLRFYENDRPVRTPSAGQVRQPLNRRGTEQWRNFEPWLDELKDALGPVLAAYPEVPAKID